MMLHQFAFSVPNSMRPGFRIGWIVPPSVVFWRTLEGTIPDALQQLGYRSGTLELLFDKKIRQLQFASDPAKCKEDPVVKALWPWHNEIEFHGLTSVWRLVHGQTQGDRQSSNP